MKKIILFALFLSISAVSLHSAEWVKWDNMPWIKKDTYWVKELNAIDSSDVMLNMGMAFYGMWALWHSTDGGYTWDTVFTNLADEDGQIFKLRDDYTGPEYCESLIRFDKSNIWVHLNSHYNRPEIWRSRDGGYTWDEDSIIYIPSKGEHIGQMQSQLNMYDTLTGIMAIFGTVDSVKYGYSTTSAVLYTADGLKSWFVFRPDTILKRPIGLWNTHIFSEDHFGFISNLGNLYGVEWKDKSYYYSKDRGKTWTRIIVPKNNEYTSLQELYFINDKVGFIIGVIDEGDEIPDCIDIIYKTTDGGETWQEIYKNKTKPNFGHIWDIAFSPDGKDGTIVANFGKILRTRDGGETWEQEYFAKEHEEEIGHLIGTRVFYIGSKPVIAALSYNGGGLFWHERPEGDINEAPEPKHTAAGHFYNNDLTIELNTKQPHEAAILSIYDMSGKRISTGKYYLEYGKNTFSMSTANYSSGTYNYTITIDEAVIFNDQFVVAK